MRHPDRLAYIRSFTPKTAAPRRIVADYRHPKPLERRGLVLKRRYLLEPQQLAHRDVFQFPKTVPAQAMRREAHRRGKFPRT